MSTPSQSRGVLAVLIGAVLCSGCHDALSVAFGAELITAQELQQGEADFVLVDVRERWELEAARIPGAELVELLDLNHYLAAHPIDTQRPLVLVCNSGRRVSLAVPTVTMHGYTRVLVLKGGIEAWQAAGLPVENGPIAAIVGSQPAAAVGGDGAYSGSRLPRVEWSDLQQLVSASAGGLVKLIYMILTFILIRRLWSARTTALRLLWHGLVWFFVGEAFCVLNFFVHGSGQVYLLDVFHGIGMVIMSALIPWGLFRLFDERVLHFADPDKRCVLQSLCGRCWKKEPVTCALQRIMLLVALMCLALTLIPFSSPLRPTQVVAMVMGEATEYGVPIVNHMVELRLYPSLALLFLLATFLMLLRGKPATVHRVEPIFFIGELTELILVVGVAWILYLLRDQLGLKLKPAPQAR